MIDKPEGIILTVGEKMFQAHGYRHWLTNFLEAMDKPDDGWFYSFRVHGVPKHDKDLLYVYLTIGGKIRFRGYYGGCDHTPEGFKEFTNGIVKGHYWIRVSGPVERAPRVIKYQGRQGFRYTNRLF